MSKLESKELGSVKAETPSGGKATLNPSDDLNIDRAHLLEEMAEQPALFAYYAQLASQANAAAKQARYERHCLEEDLIEEYRQKYPMGGRGGVSEARIRQMVQTNTQMRMSHVKVMNAEKRAEKLQSLKEAFQQRLFMLQSINATQNRDQFNEKPIDQLKRKASEIVKSTAR